MLDLKFRELGEEVRSWQRFSLSHFLLVCLMHQISFHIMDVGGWNDIYLQRFACSIATNFSLLPFPMIRADGGGRVPGCLGPIVTSPIIPSHFKPRYCLLTAHRSMWWGYLLDISILVYVFPDYIETPFSIEV